MADYSSYKVPELKKLLAEKKLPQNGNKSELIARLREEDSKNTGSTAAAETAADRITEKDEVDYADDNTTSATTAPKTAAVKQSPAHDKSVPKAVPTASKSTDKATTEQSASKAEASESATTPAEPVQSFAMGLSKTAADAEAQKRAERAKRFGIEEDEDAKRRAERAKRFGIDEAELASSLDAALPEKSLKRGRGRGGDDDDGRAGKRQSVGRRGDGGRQARNGRDGRSGRDSRPNGSKQGGAKKSGIMDDPAERAKAEQRAARFAAV